MDTVISDLKEKLSLSNYAKEQGDFFDYFKEIANLLMNQCVIVKGGTHYEIVELEFYLYTPNHQDVITYPRDIRKAGQWFFHQSGVDLTFESDGNHFGGILIRGIRDISSGKQIFGPQNCVNWLWDKHDAFEINPSEYPIVSSAVNIRSVELKNVPRHIPLYKGTTRAHNIKKWSDRLPATCFILNTTVEERTKLVYESDYRFFKMDAINQNDEAWKKYAAKPKGKTNRII